MAKPKKKRTYDREEYERRQRPPKQNLKVVRVCRYGGCGVSFAAETRFLRLCPYHRKLSDRFMA